MRSSAARGLPLALACMVALAVSSCGGSQPATKIPALSLPSSLVHFAAYQLVQQVGPDSPTYAGPSTPHSLGKVTLPRSERIELKQVPALGPLLAKQGFAVVRSGSGLFQAEYEGNLYGGWPVYVTTDAAYNAWHLAFDKILRDLEQKVLLPKLETLVTGLVRNAQKTEALTPGDDASRVAQLYEVAAAELGLKVPLGPLAKKEKALIDDHSSTALSPVLGVKLDYSLFAPRGHYNLNADLRRFFVAMSVLGQFPFCLPGTFDCNGLEPARLGIMAASNLTGDPALTKLWRQIYDPTSFLVGLSDDYTPIEVAAAAQKAGHPGTPLDDASVRRVVKALVAARPVRIDPQRASIRIMGTRFVTDSYLLDQLVFPHVGTADKPRLLPSALDLASAFGSQVAAKALDQAGATAYANYDAQLKAVQEALSARRPADWGSTVYDAWLYALQPMFTPHGKAFPDYMRSDAWAAKDLQSGLGSYTELKHDTILFAKQLVAEAGGDPVIGDPLNWAEPDPAAFERLAAATDLLAKGLAERGLLTADAGRLLATENNFFGFLGRVAGGELAGRPLASKDNHRLRFIGGELSAIWWRTSERSNPNPSIPDQSAIVADIASGPNGVLELATGDVDTLYVVVPGRNGTYELARGGVYSYYEFTSPPGERLTDSDWRALIASGKAPARPGWESVFRVACPHPGQGCSPTYQPG